MNKKELENLLGRHKAGKTTAQEERYLEEFFSTYKPNGDSWDAQQLGDKNDFNSRLLDAIQSAVHEQDDEQNNTSTLRRFAVWRYAAVLALLIAAGFAVHRWVGTPLETQTNHTVWVEKVTHHGEKVTFKLPDGSIIKLNAGSKLEFPSAFLHDERRVKLTGEAFFEVARNEKKPFVIQSGHIITTVLGTSFNISAYPEKDVIEVAVATGKVKVESIQADNEQGQSDVVYLHPDRKATYRLKENELLVSAFNPDIDLAWRAGVLSFSHADEITVIQELERWYGVELTVMNDSPKAWDLTARFDNQSLDEIMQSLSHTAQFDYTIRNKQVQITYKKL